MLRVSCTAGRIMGESASSTSAAASIGPGHDRHLRQVRPDAELHAAAALYQLVAQASSRGTRAGPEAMSGQASIAASEATSVSA